MNAEVAGLLLREIPDAEVHDRRRRFGVFSIDLDQVRRVQCTFGCACNV